ncbi:hypothetical protein V8C40DRAFT_245724 [Trichoderma camerunense]
MSCLVWTCSNNVGVANSLVATGRFSRSFSVLPEFEEFTPVDLLLAIGALVSASNGGGRQTKTANPNKFPDGHALYTSRHRSIKGKRPLLHTSVHVMNLIALEHLPISQPPVGLC